MRVLIAATVVMLLSSTAMAAPSPMMGTQPMMGSHAMMGPARTMGAGMMVIHHKVADYNKWRVVYEADQPNRIAAGLTNCHVHQSLDDANDVFIGCSMADVVKARSFAGSKTLAETMTKAGVVGKPQILFLALPK